VLAEAAVVETAARLHVVGVDVVEEVEDVAPGPATGVLEGEGGLGALFFAVEVHALEVLAIQVRQAVVLPVEQVARERLLTGEQSG
jgi:hypothetical protein